MTDKQTDMIKIIMSNYAYEHQREIFVEECAEAIQAAQKRILFLGNEES